MDHNKVSRANLEKLRNIFKALLCYKDSCKTPFFFHTFSHFYVVLLQRISTLYLQGYSRFKVTGKGNLKNGTAHSAVDIVYTNLFLIKLCFYFEDSLQALGTFFRFGLFLAFALPCHFRSGVTPPRSFIFWFPLPPPPSPYSPDHSKSSNFASCFLFKIICWLLRHFSPSKFPMTTIGVYMAGLLKRPSTRWSSSGYSVPNHPLLCLDYQL